MSVLMDDPTTYLTRDSDNVALVLAGNADTCRTQARMYGVSIQVDMPGGKGIRCISTHAQAVAAMATYPQDTPWCLVNDGLWAREVYDALRAYFGPPVTMDKALDVKTVGIAWRPDKYPVYGM